MTKHERPGVYSNYDASAVINSSGSRGIVGLAALCSGKPAAVYELNRYEDAVSSFGAANSLTKLVRVLFLNGAAQVKAVPVPERTAYSDAFARLQAEDDISVLVCDSSDLTVQQKLRDSVTEASAARRERIAVVPGGSSETVSALINHAESLNCERMILTAPSETQTSAAAAAAVAGAIASESDPAVPLGGAVLNGLGELTASYDDSEVDLLIRSGVTPLERVGGQVSVIRGVTTRTKTGSVADTTWRELTTIRIVDDVIPTVRNSPPRKVPPDQKYPQSRSAIRSQVVLELENKMAREIITGYDGVTVTADTENPTVCLVDFSFTVAHGLNQIWVSAHITL